MIEVIVFLLGLGIGAFVAFVYHDRLASLLGRKP